MLFSKMRLLVEDEFKKLVKLGERNIEVKFLNLGQPNSTGYLKEISRNILDSVANIEKKLNDLIQGYAIQQKASFEKIQKALDDNRSKLSQNATSLFKIHFDKYGSKITDQLLCRIKKEFDDELSSISYNATLALDPILSEIYPSHSNFRC